MDSMIHIGGLIEARRRQLGLSRLQIANCLGVTSQTVLNLERDPNYNTGTNLLVRLEEALQVTFEITMKEREAMNTKIRMGNDEFILYIRKNYPNCTMGNERLARLIWEWIDNCDTPAEKIHDGKSVPCLWGASATMIDESKLPKTAQQFQFERKHLPKLYDYLDALGSGQKQHLTSPIPEAVE
jgi:transcriptional regulator with XRE-family HTH domain